MKIQKYLGSLFVLALAVAVMVGLPVTARAEETSGTCGENLTWVLDEEGTLTISGTGAMEEYDTKHNKVPWPQTYTKLVIEEGVTRIGKYAFWGGMITELTIPDSVVSIGEGAFRNMKKLKVLNIGTGLKSVWKNAFFDCVALEQINFGAAEMSDLDYSNMVFGRAGTEGPGITVTIMPTVKRFPGFLFFPERDYRLDYNPNIVKLNFAEGSICETIGKAAFCGCDNLKSVYLADSVKTIGEGAFSGCDALKELVFGDTLEVIGGGAFAGCSRLSFADFRGIKRIEDGAFSDTGFESINIPDTVEYVGNSAFADCNVLRSATVGKVGEFGYGVFADCGGLQSVTFAGGPIEIGSTTFENCKKLTTVVLGEGITRIGKQAFRECDSLTTITLPNSLTSIGELAFQESGLTSLVIPDSVTELDEGAIQHCLYLVYVRIGRGLTKLPECSFYTCKNLRLVVFPDTITEVGDMSFRTSSKLWHVLYMGTQKQWEAMVKPTDNTILADAFVHFNCSGDEVVDLEKQICVLCCEHSYSVTGTTPPSCTESGTKSQLCSICGHTDVAEDDPATGHDFGSWKTVKKATFLEEGEEKRVCHCGETESRSIPKDMTLPIVIGVAVVGIAAAVFAVILMRKKTKKA